MVGPATNFAPDMWQGSCPWCSGPTNAVFHSGPCPRVKAIEYHPDGRMKRVEFHEPATRIEDRS